VNPTSRKGREKWGTRPQFRPNRWLVERSSGRRSPPVGDSREIFQSLGPEPLWQPNRCLRTAQNTYALAEPSLLSRGTRQGVIFS
jgi:hypothetical protein